MRNISFSLTTPQIRARTKELLETNQLLLKTQKELLAYKKGLTV